MCAAASPAATRRALENENLASFQVQDAGDQLDLQLIRSRRLKVYDDVGAVVLEGEDV
jgi:hypothetical protein